MTFANESTIESQEQQRVYTIADLGIRANPSTQQTIIGPVSHLLFDDSFDSNWIQLSFTQWKTRSLYSLTIYEKIYSCLSLISLLALLGLTIDRLIELKSSDPDFTFAFLLFWTTCFCFVYIIQVLIKNLLNRVLDKLIINKNISIFREYFVSEPLN
jgi:hypothetical protein